MSKPTLITTHLAFLIQLWNEVSYSGGIQHIVKKSLRCKRQQSELYWKEGAKNLVGIYLKNYECCHLNHRIYFLYYYLWQITTANLRQIQKTRAFTRHSNDLYLPQNNLAIYQRGVYYSGVKMFNNLPSNIKNTSGNL